MTTIAVKDRVMAADSRQTGDFIDQIAAQKIWRIGDEIYGFCGSMCEMFAFKNWKEAGGKKASMPKFSDDFTALVIDKDGVWWLDKMLTKVPTGSVTAIGSGSKFAMGAMMAGADARLAVEIASKLDGATGGEITAERYEAAYAGT